MKRLSISLTALIALSLPGTGGLMAQSMDDLNLQLHGYATQGFVYSTNNNWNTTESSDGSAAWTEAVVNVTAQPQHRLRIGVQGRYFLLGNYGNEIVLDWAQADLKINEHFGLRAGKVKSPVGLLNDTQDVDPAYLWSLLPQSIYRLASRDSILTHFGAVAYGSFKPGENLGKLEYHGFGGTRVLAGDDGFFQPLRDQGLVLPNGLSGPVYGIELAWHLPIQGLLVGASESEEHLSGDIDIGPMHGTVSDNAMVIPIFFGKYEHRRLMVAGEYNRLPLQSTTHFPHVPAIQHMLDRRSFYAMASYRLAGKLLAGLYYSSMIDRDQPVGSNRYQKDWALSGRYDFNPFFYLKAEEHIVDGTAVGFSTSNNAGGLKPNSRLTLLKLGVSF